jgi:hypothetical protein
MGPCPKPIFTTPRPTKIHPKWDMKIYTNWDMKIYLQAT